MADAPACLHGCDAHGEACPGGLGGSCAGRCRQHAAPYRSLGAAKAAGYVPLTPTGAKVVHYINPTVYRQGHLLDPHALPVLVYVNTAHGAVLSAAMYLMPFTASQRPPQPGGCLTQWHIHTNLCFRATGVVGTCQLVARAPREQHQRARPRR